MSAALNSRAWLFIFIIFSLVLVAGVMRAMGSGMGVEVEVEADMGPLDSSACPRALPCASVAKAKSDVGYEREFLSDAVTLREAKIQAKDQIPIPSGSINVLDVDAARSAVVTLQLGDPNTHLPYATCALTFSKFSGKNKSAKALYALAVQTKLRGANHVAAKKQNGGCSQDAIDLDVQNNDTAYISINGTDVFSGVFGAEDENEDD